MADGIFARLNGKMLSSGEYNDQIVSVVGKFGSPQPGGSVDFVTSDSVKISVSTEHASPPEFHENPPAVELVGQPDGEQFTMFVVRELSTDMDLDVYNKMIEVQHNPKYQQYFTSVTH